MVGVDLVLAQRQLLLRLYQDVAVAGGRHPLPTHNVPVHHETQRVQNIALIRQRAEL